MLSKLEAIMKKIIIATMFLFLFSCSSLPNKSGELNKNCFFNESLMSNTQVFNVYFDFNKSSVRLAEKQQLAILIEALKASPENLKISLLGYTDSVGSSKVNKELAKKRVGSVKKFILDQGFKNLDLVEGVGKTSLKNQCNLLKHKSERNECNEEFRRVEVIVYYKTN